jgi:iron(III) transport system ATP-binding protein
LPPAQRDYGIVFQSYALFPNLSVADNVAYGLVNRKVAKAKVTARVDELLRLVGLPGSNAKFPAQLSGGQQQRVALARALATAPGLLLLDEPLSALDALERVRLRQEIRSLQRTLGVTTIMVTHDQEEALSIADRIVVMNHGRHRAGRHADAGLPGALDTFRGRLRRQDQRAVRAAATRPPPRHRRDPLRVRARRRRRARRQGLPAPGGRAGPAHRAGDANVFMAVIEKIEFLGSYCLVRVGTQGLAGQPVTVYLSLNFLAEQGLAVGSRLPLRLLPDRMRLF